MTQWLIVSILLVTCHLSLVTSGRAQSVYTAASCNESDVQAAVTTEQASPQDGDTIAIPAGNCVWSNSWTLTVSNSLNIVGAGAQSSTGGSSGTVTGTDSTIIQDNVSRSGSDIPLWEIVTAANKSYRITGIAFYWDSANTTTTYNGSFRIAGQSHAVRLDHCHFHFPGTASLAVGIYGWVNGVEDHCYKDSDASGETDTEIVSFDAYNGDTYGFGGGSWADGNDYASNPANFWFIEDELVNAPRNQGAMGTDCQNGGRYVYRHSNLSPGALITHDTIAQGPRGCRAIIVDDDNFNYASTANAQPIYFRAGTALIYNNTLSEPSQANQFISLQVDRSQNTSRNYGSSTPGGVAYCGPGQAPTLGSGTLALVSGTTYTFTVSSGTPFSTSWTTYNGGPIVEVYVSPNWIPLAITTVNSTTQVTGTTANGNAPAAGTYPFEIASIMDGNTDATGYPCLDQPGRGKSDLLSTVISGSTYYATFVDAALSTGGIGAVTLASGGASCSVNDTFSVTQSGGSLGEVQALAASGGAITRIAPYYAGSGYSRANGVSVTNLSSTCTTPPTINITGLVGWPHNAAEPIYVWNNTPTAGSVAALVGTPFTTSIQNNRDYYMQFGNSGNSGSFTGAAGVGSGLLAARPATCTAGVAYWATDTNTLYQCGSANAWVTYYTPEPYPHPLTLTSGGGTPGFDTYGGSTMLPCPNTTGHFITWKNPATGRWYFCTSGSTGGNTGNTGHVYDANAIGGIATNTETDCNGRSNAQSYVQKFANCGISGKPACTGGQDPGTTYNWGWWVEKSMQAWGFNCVGQDLGAYVKATTTCTYGPLASANGYCNWPGGTNPLPMPYVPEPATSRYAIIGDDAAGNPQGEAVKDLMVGLDNYWTGFRGDSVIDWYDPKLSTYWAEYLTTSNASDIVANNPWIAFVLVDDSDSFWGAGAGPDFYTNTTPNTMFSWSVALASPAQTAVKIASFENGGPFLYAHTTVDSKADATNPAHGTCSLTHPCSLRDFLYDEYSGSISALNTAWSWTGCATGSNCQNYTTFDSTCTMVGTVGDFGSHCASSASAETLFTGNGSTQTFTHTIANLPFSPDSLLITVGGSPMAGDTPWFAYEGGANDVSCDTNQPLCTSGATSKNYGGLTGPSFLGVSINQSGGTATATLASWDNFPAWAAAGMNVQISLCSGASGYNGTWTIASVNASAKQFTFATGWSGTTAETCKVVINPLYPGAFVYTQMPATASGGTVTLTTYGTLPTGANGATVKVTGCNNSSYTGTFTVTGVTAGTPSTFTYSDGSLTGSTTACAAYFYPQLSSSGTTVTVATAQLPPNLTAGDAISFNNCTTAGGSNIVGYWGVWTVASVNTGSNSFTFTANSSGLASGYCPNMGSSLVNYASGNGVLKLRFMQAPASGVAGVANYVYHGWASGGTGLMDEDGIHTQVVGTNPYCLSTNSSYATYNYCAPGNPGHATPVNICNGVTPCQPATDLQNFEAQDSAKYFMTMKQGLTNAGVGLPYFGLDTVGDYNVAAYSAFLQGEGAWTDGGFFNAPFNAYPVAGGAAMPSEYQYLTQYFGDKPFIVYVLDTAVADSSYSCHAPGSMDVGGGQVNRGLQIYDTLNYVENTASYNGDYPVVGWDQWTWQDFQNVNQGLVTVQNNPYDGQSATVAAGVDPFGVPTGGEVANYGNFITWLEQANDLWLQLLVGQIRSIPGHASVSGPVR